MKEMFVKNFAAPNCYYNMTARTTVPVELFTLGLVDRVALLLVDCLVFGFVDGFASLRNFSLCKSFAKTLMFVLKLNLEQ